MSPAGSPTGSPAQTRAKPAATPATPATPSSPSTARAAVPARALTSQEIDQQLGAKIVVLKNWGITTIRSEIRPKLIKTKLHINRPGLQINDLVAIGQSVKGIKAEADKSVPFVPSRPPPQFMPSPADRTEALKLVMANTVDDIVFILDGLHNLLQTTVLTQEVLLAVQAAKTLKPLVAAAPPNN